MAKRRDAEEVADEMAAVVQEIAGILRAHRDPQMGPEFRVMVVKHALDEHGYLSDELESVLKVVRLLNSLEDDEREIVEAWLRKKCGG